MDYGKPSQRRFRQLDAAEATLDAIEGGQNIYRPKARVRPFGELVRVLYGLLYGARFRLLLVVAAQSVATASRLAYPASPKLAIDYVLMDHPGPAGIPKWLGLPTDRTRLLIILGAVVVTIELVSVALDIWAQYRFKLISWRVQIKFSERIFGRALRLPLWRLQGIKSGGLASVLREDARSAADLLFQLVVTMWRAGLQLMGTLLVLATVDPFFFAAALGLLPAVWLSHRRFTGRIRPIYRAARRARQDADAWVAEAVGGIRTIRAFHRERSTVSRYVAQSHLMLRQVMRGFWRSIAVEAGWRIMVPLASAAVLLYGGRRVLDGRLTLGDLTMFLGYVALLLGPLQQMVSGAMRIQDELAGFSRALDIAEAEPEPVGPKARAAPRDGAGNLRFEHVSYSYPDDGRQVLADVDFELEPGETVALIGTRGAGKTTTVNLLARFYTPTKGRILLDGIDVQEMSLDSYRDLVGLVDQDALLFDTTIRDNIAFGAPGATDEEVRSAAQRANALGFIEALPGGLDTLIGERGVRLSGGQRQCIALARALLRKPRILILDEATNHLDAASETSILKSVEALGTECTRLIVGHRLSTIRAADRIVMLENGRIVLEGSHDELVAKGGRYVEFLGNQLEAKSSESAARA